MPYLGLLAPPFLGVAPPKIGGGQTQKWGGQKKKFRRYAPVIFLAPPLSKTWRCPWWHATNRRPVGLFRATMSLKRFKHISRILRFDEKETRTARRARDKLAPIRDVFDAWVTTLSKSFIPYDNVTIDEQLVAFRGRCTFRMYMKSKPAKYGLKL